MKLKRFVYAALLAVLLLATPAAVLAAPASAPPPMPLADDTVIFGSNHTLAAGETTDNLIVFGGNVTVEEGATVRQNVVVLGGNVDMNGRVGESVVVIGGNVDLGPSAVVEQDLVTFGGHISRAPGAQVLGNQASDTRLFDFDGLVSVERTNRFAAQALRAFQLLGMLAAATFLVLLTPRQLSNTADVIAQNGVLAGGLGMLTYVLLPIALVVTLITCILPPIILLVVVLGSIFGWVALGLELGKRIEQFLKVTWPLEAQAVLGTLALGLLSFFLRALPCVGWLGVFALGSIGLGATLLSRFGTQPWSPGQPPAALPPPASPRRPARKAAAKPAAVKPAATKSKPVRKPKAAGRG